MDTIAVAGAMRLECSVRMTQRERYNFQDLIMGPPILARILAKFSLGEMGRLLVKSKKSWRNQKYLGEIGSILVK